ncbi:MAG: DUF3383 domain-containing protein [Candidatus Adiutrix sp.]|nr:DUF3383 domain-containing protein [Candidatus Adiutrix sp.]
MAIPASHIVSIMPRVITGGSRDLELNGLLLTENDIISASTLVLSFPSARAVGDYFGLDSVEYAAADVYFTSYNNKFTAPKAFYIARRIAGAVPAWLRSGRNNKALTDFQAITTGALTISLDNTAYAVSGVDLSAVTSFSEVAEIVAEAINDVAGETVVTGAYSSLTKAFTFTSAAAGEASAVSYGAAGSGGADLAAALNLTESSGAVLSKGSEALTVTAQMEAILAKSQNWVSFTTAWETEAAEALLWAAWANLHYGWLYVNYTTDPNTLSPDSAIDPASLIKDAGYDHTAVIFGGLDYAAFIMGVVASIAWQRINGTITAAFKRQSGLAALVLDEGTAHILESKKCNYFGNFATRNAEFLFLFPGCLSASDYGFIDPYVNSIWFNNRLQVALMDGITRAGRVPYNTRGYTMIKAWMMDPINEARTNAAIEPGIVLSERQRSEVMNEAGLDISQELWTQGYYVQVLDPGAAVRAQRGSPVISLWYTYGGAVQKIEVASTAIL